MTNLWECFQGLLFMAVFGGLTRLALGNPEKPARSRQTAPEPAPIPVPRSARREEHESLPIG